MLNLHAAKFDEIVRLLTSHVQTILIVGDNGVGKKTLLRRAVSHVAAYGVLTEVPKLDMETARGLKAQALRRSELLRLYLIDGDHASVQAYNAILKLLEEPPPGSIYMIAASKPPIPTIVSRCHYVMIPPLGSDDLKAALGYKGMSERVISSVVPYAHGSVTEALRVYEKFEEKRRLAPFIRALKERDLVFVLRQVKPIEKDDISILIELCDDVILSRYGLIQQDLATIVPAAPDFLLKVKGALLSGRSPSLAWLRAWFETA